MEWETPEQRAIRRKHRMRLAVVGPIAVLAVGIAVVAYMRDPENTNSPAPQVSPAFVGEWRGVADNGRDTFDIVLRITGDTADRTVTNKASGARCEYAERVSAATETELTLTARSSTGMGCDTDPRTTAQLHTDGGLAYRTGPAGSTVTGTLRKG
ncbi:hypothetical protein NDR87_00455 [Nocardia sp. CDC159]|uniref:Uncharacterized protein n=1 Tax=Nocardia pulmonis TaxID=2951408 RepID=A0A9X2E3Q4_9NOCA|nr:MULTISPECIES: hypothetical protein [Nocardia]MCM6772518.1 hypothetical protein [Nocardia pulmonis]MCM6784824.1 hypothetical protein [Nocardia sp. CDC159]